MRQTIAKDSASVLVLAVPRLSTRSRFFGASAFSALAIFASASVSNADPLVSETGRRTSTAATKPAVIIPTESTKQQAKNFVSVGPLFGFTGHLDTPVSGILGFEISYVRYPTTAFNFGIGGFAQAQTVGFDHGRFAFGPQFNFMMFGTELGAYLEESVGERATTVGLHASPFVSLGFFSAALRIGIPLGTVSEGKPYDIDLGLVCAIKMPIPLDGQLFGLAFH
jgi:hypothetical protein